MPVDPAISLQGQPPPQPTNPFELIGRYAQTQQALNENKLFAQTYAARQAAGQIVASAPDPETAVHSLMSNPLTAAFAPEMIQNMAGVNQTLATTQGIRQDQAGTAFTGMVKNLPAVIADPSQWTAATQVALNNVAPGARPQVAASLEALRKSLTDGLPTDPAQAAGEMRRRAGAWFLSAGGTPEILQGVMGTPDTLSLGNKAQPVVKAPIQGGLAGEPGGSVAPVGNGLGIGLAPQLTDVPNPQGGASRVILHDPGAPGVTPLGSTPTTAQAGENTAAASAAEDNTKAANEVASVLPVRIKALDTIVDTLKQFKPGGGAPTRLAAAQIVQGLKNAGVPGIDDAMVDKIASGSLPAQQLFDTQLKPLLTNMLTHDAAGQGRVMLPEVEAYIHLLDTAKDPRTIVRALNNIRYGYRVGIDRAQKWPSYRDLGKNPADFNNWYINQLDPKKLPSKVGGMSLAPVDESSVLGGGAAPRRSLDDIFGGKGKP